MYFSAILVTPTWKGHSIATEIYQSHSPYPRLQTQDNIKIHKSVFYNIECLQHNLGIILPFICSVYSIKDGVSILNALLLCTGDRSPLLIEYLPEGDFMSLLLPLLLKVNVGDRIPDGDLKLLDVTVCFVLESICNALFFVIVSSSSTKYTVYIYVVSVIICIEYIETIITGQSLMDIVHVGKNILKAL